MYTDFLISILLIAMFDAFVLTLLRKWGAIEWLQIHGSELISKMANCNFCLSWWSNLVICSAIAIWTKDYSFLFVPFFATNATRFLL